jgi:hypothetical protein
MSGGASLVRGTIRGSGCADAPGMERVTIECLHCGKRRTVERHDTGECPRCTYVGWAPVGALDEPTRRALRDRPVERRRLRAVA